MSGTSGESPDPPGAADSHPAAQHTPRTSSHSSKGSRISVRSGIGIASSTASSPSKPVVWVQQRERKQGATEGGVAAQLPMIGDPFKVFPTENDIDALKKAIKAKKPNALAKYDADQLTIYKASDLSKTPLNAKSSVEDVNYVFEVPLNQQAGRQATTPKTTPKTKRKVKHSKMKDEHIGSGEAPFSFSGWLSSLRLLPFSSTTTVVPKQSRSPLPFGSPLDPGSMDAWPVTQNGDKENHRLLPDPAEKTTLRKRTQASNLTEAY